MFDTEKFAKLLKLAIEERTINEFALHSKISATYISKLLRGLVINAPGAEVIRKISSHAYNNVTYIDFMIAAGHIVNSDVDYILKNEEFNNYTPKQINYHKEKTHDYYMSDNEKILLNTFEKLNDRGKERAIENLSDLAEIPKYTRKEREKLKNA